jgi:SAM-dependent methyltransferase
MGWWGRLWDLAYLWRAPWDIGGPRPELVRLVESGELEPCRAIDLGCGIGENVIYLAQQGFDATGVDISPRAIAKAQRKAQAAGVSPRFLVGDVTDLMGVEGPFDLLVDNGCLHSLFNSAARESYVRVVLRLTRPGSRYWLRCFVRAPRQRFSLQNNRLVMKPGEVERRFGRKFDIEELWQSTPST